MKKILKLSLVIAVLLTGMSTYAIDGNADFALHVRKGDGKLISFALNNVPKANLSIYDKDGILIYSEYATGKGGILKAFDLQEFPEGTYYLDIEDNVKKVRYEINVSNEASTLYTKAVSQTYKTNYDKNTSVAIR
ncbi:secretion protein [Flavobacterium sp. LS1R49]|uniref:Secretion protein n=1 Tax=Flavobacterium shii TaxID=2987687 RepID=A0A9X2ZJQ3_9FLAO|nr:secretion protein [Flavobacterium shii]MCV9929961.1 secretion protein [Flavobacterium shii]